MITRDTADGIHFRDNTARPGKKNANKDQIN